MKKSDEIREKIKKKEEQIEKRKKTTEKYVEKRRGAYRESRESLEKVLGYRHSQTYFYFKSDVRYHRMKEEELKEKYTSPDGRYQLSEEIYHRMVETYNLEVKYDNFSNEHRVFLDLYRDEEKTERFMRNEKEARRIDLINRVTHVVGEIVDAQGLTFGYNDGINGVVIGKKGKARVQTIDAGGHNIQRYHYRVLVHPIKEKGSLGEKISSAEKRTGSPVGGKELDERNLGR